MDKKGNTNQFFHRLQKIIRAIKKTYLYRMITKFLSVACSIILVMLLIVGAFMFYFNIKANSFNKRGQEYTAPFGLYTIISGSMEPNVSVYDVVVAIDEDISKIKVGDIVTFISNWDINYGLTVTHRVVGITKGENGEYQLITKGDNNGSKDGGTVTQHNLVGKVVGRIPALGRLQFFLATKMGWFIVVFIPALAIIIFDMIKIFKLYVLKNKIENVKPVNSDEPIEKENDPIKIDDIIDSKTETKKISDVILEPVLEPKSITNVVLEPIEEDKNIDTVELPKVDEDGKVKENTSELPLVNNNANKEAGLTLEDIIKEDFDDSNSIPKVNDLPQIPIKLKNNVEVEKETNSRIPLRRRK